MVIPTSPSRSSVAFAIETRPLVNIYMLLQTNVLNVGSVEGEYLLV